MALHDSPNQFIYGMIMLLPFAHMSYPFRPRALAAPRQRAPAGPLILAPACPPPHPRACLEVAELKGALLELRLQLNHLVVGGGW